MGDIQRAHDYLEAKEATERLRGQQEKTSPAVATFLVLASAGAVMTVIEVLFSGEPWREWIWRIPLGAVVIWPVSALLVLLFGAGKVKIKSALVLGAIPSLFALTPFILVFVILFVIAVSSGIVSDVSDWVESILRKRKSRSA